MTSVLNVDTIANKAGTGPVGLTKQQAARVTAGVTLSGGSPVLNQSLNVSSLTDTATGKVTYNFTNSFTDAGYSSIGCTNNTGSVRTVTTASEATSSVRSINFTTSSENDNDVSATVHGDLA